MTIFLNLETQCQMKHLLKAEVNLKEVIEKAVRQGGEFKPSGATARNYWNVIGQLEATNGHYEEFMGKYPNKYFYVEMMDSVRALRQDLMQSIGEHHSELFVHYRRLQNLIGKQETWMRKEGKRKTRENHLSILNQPIPQVKKTIEKTDCDKELLLELESENKDRKSIKEWLGGGDD